MMGYKNILVLTWTWSIATSLILPNQQNLVSVRLLFQNERGLEAGDTASWKEPTALPFRARFRLKHSNNNDSPDDNPSDNAIPEKIRWIFDETEGDFFDEEDDSFFDDLFLTDDEDDGDFITDYDDDEGPEASLNEDDLMRLHDMYPELNIAKTTAVAAAAAAATNQTFTASDNQGSKRIAETTATEQVQETNTTNAGTTVSLDNILASLESDLSYFYLRDELGISEDVMWKITNDAPSVLGLKANNVRNKVHVLQALVGFTDDEIRQLISSQPTLLQLSVKKNLSPSILFWIRQLQFGKEELKTVILGCPALLKYSRSNVNAKLVFFRKTMGYSVSDCRKIFVKEPRLLTASVKTGLIPRLTFLHKEVVISITDIRKIVLKNPRVLMMSVEQNLTPKCVFYFIMTLQMNTKDVGKLLVKYPQILDYNLEHHTLPIHHYFLSLDFSTYEFSRILQKHPRLITYSLIHIKRRIGYLRFGLSLEANAIRRILYQCPQIVSLGQENLERTVDFLLQAVAPGASLQGSTTSASEVLDDQDALAIVQILIAGLPTLLGLSIDKNLAPKVEYLRAKLGQDELASALLRMPALLGYSLQNRIQPRLERMMGAKVPPQKITVAITLKEDAFEQWLQRQIQNLQKPDDKKAGAAPRGRPARKLPSKATTQVVEAMPASTVPLIDQIEETARKRANSVRKTPLNDDNDDNDETNTDGNNSRVVEDGGKIIHWRRRR